MHIVAAPAKVSKLHTVGNSDRTSQMKINNVNSKINDSVQLN